MNKALFQKTDGQLSTAYDLDGGQIEVEKKSGCEQGQTSSYLETKIYPSRVLQVMAANTDAPANFETMYDENMNIK